MNFHEYQSKDLFEQYGVVVPGGRVASTVTEAVEAAKAMGGDMWVIKAQVHAGGRGKAGGVKLVRSIEEVRAVSDAMLGMTIETYQTAGVALPVNRVLVAEATDIDQELYLSVLVDRANKCVTFMASAAGGVDIEQVAADTPEKIITVEVDNTEGLQPYQCRQMGFALGLNPKQVGQLTKMMLSSVQAVSRKGSGFDRSQSAGHYRQRRFDGAGCQDQR